MSRSESNKTKTDRICKQARKIAKELHLKYIRSYRSAIRLKFYYIWSKQKATKQTISKIKAINGVGRVEYREPLKTHKSCPFKMPKSIYVFFG